MRAVESLTAYRNKPKGPIINRNARHAWGMRFRLPGRLGDSQEDTQQWQLAF
jgi:hypothetical protein